MVEKRPPIKLTNRDFETIKKSLVEYAKVYYPDTYRDFNDASFGALMMDLVAYVGDILSFYVDYSSNESFLDSAIERRNVIRLAKQLGYKYPAAPSSTGTVNVYITVPAGTNGSFDTTKVPILKKGATLQSDSGASFILNEDVDFLETNAEVVVATVDSDGTPTSYAIKKSAQVVSGELETQLVNIDSLEKFLKLELESDNVSEILSVVDSEGNDFHEVEYLSQNVIFEAVRNVNSDSELAPYILRERLVPRRFIVEYDEDYRPTLTFGYGSESTLANNEYPDPSSVVLQQTGKQYYTDNSFDPNKVLETDKFGVIPPVGTMSVTLRKNSELNVNVPALSLNSIANTELYFRTDVSDSVRSTALSSIQVENENPINGQVRKPTIEDVRRASIDNFATQNRAVTKQDYLSLIYRMPSKFGAVKRANIVQDTDSFKRNLNLYLVAENEQGHLTTATNTLKNNVKRWLNNYKMLNDSIDILDGKVANIGIEFEVIIKLDANPNQVLVECIDRLQQKFATKFDMGTPLYISEIYKLLNSIPEVVDTRDVKIVNKNGSGYSGSVYDAENNVSSDGRYISVPEDTVLEIRYLDKDIIGVVV